MSMDVDPSRSNLSSSAISESSMFILEGRLVAELRRAGAGGGGDLTVGVGLSSLCLLSESCEVREGSVA